MNSGITCFLNIFIVGPEQGLRDSLLARLLAQFTSRNRKSYNDEHEMVYDILGDDENIEGLLGCTWGPEEAFEGMSTSFLQRSSQFDGIVLATSRRVLFMKKKGFSKIVSEMPLRRIETVDHGDPELAEAGITGACGGNKAGANSLRTYKLRNAQGSEARRFIDFVRDHLSTPPSPTV